MHIADGMIPLPWAGAAALIAVPFVWKGARVVRETMVGGDPQQRAMVAFAGALTFAFSSVPIPLPFFGISSHLCFTPLLALLVGFYPTVFLTALILLVQFFLLGHGGVTTLGANLLTLGILGPASAIFVHGVLRWAPKVQTLGAVFIAHVAIYLGACLLASSGLSPEQWTQGIILMFAILAPLHIPLALLEGVMSSGAMRYARLATKRHGFATIALVGILLLPTSLYAAAPADIETVDESLALAVSRAHGDEVHVELEDPMQSLGLMVFFATGFLAGRTSVGLKKQSQGN